MSTNNTTRPLKPSEVSDPYPERSSYVAGVRRTTTNLAPTRPDEYQPRSAPADPYPVTASLEPGPLRAPVTTTVATITITILIGVAAVTADATFSRTAAALATWLLVGLATIAAETRLILNEVGR